MGNKYQQVNNKKICDISYGKKKSLKVREMSKVLTSLVLVIPLETI